MNGREELVPPIIPLMPPLKPLLLLIAVDVPVLADGKGDDDGCCVEEYDGGGGEETVAFHAWVDTIVVWNVVKDDSYSCSYSSKRCPSMRRRTCCIF